MEARQTAAFDKAGAFFAFSAKQFDEAKKPDVKYVNAGAGMICPSDTLQTLITELDTIYKESIAQDIAENGLTGIIRRELSNHEAYYTRDLESTSAALSEYPVTLDDIRAVFNNQNHIINQPSLCQQ